MATGEYFVRASTADDAVLLRAEDEAWRGADRLSWGIHGFRTSFRALWSPGALSLRFDATDPHPWSTMKRRDEPIWDEEVVEIFLDLDGSGTHYAEIELSPANVVTDVRMIQGSPDKKMDLSWNLEGLKSAVSSKEGRWTGCLSLPWSGFRTLPSSRNVSLPPKRGDRWRFNVYRIERPGGKAAPEENVSFEAYSPTGDPSFHVPASFQGFVFS